MKLQINIPKRTPDPQHRIKAFQSRLIDSEDDALLGSDDPIEDAILRVLQGEVDVPEEISYAFELHLDDYIREVLEAFILAGARPSDIQNALDINQTVAELFAYYFFDVRVFRNKLEKEAFVRHQCLDTNNGRSAFGKAILTSALERGLDYLKARFSHGKHIVPPLQAVNEVITESYVKFCESKKTVATSEKAREARQNAVLLVKALQAVPDVEKLTHEEKDNFVLNLRKRIEETKREINKDDIVS